MSEVHATASKSSLLNRHEKVENAKREAKRQQELERRFNKEGDVSDDSDVDEDKILDEEEAGVYRFHRHSRQFTEIVTQPLNALITRLKVPRPEG